ncbi:MULTISPECIES: LamB/YcsF family protein [Virgibacillus]|uniref:5-oxoprolinase subunit A n=2 Tax=Virgibacillus TaxID=84406 RepID=A0A024QAN5_9BACI|nr:MULTISPECIES: 5-oxoprolinase subunit PxpA [Virgibacillus]EQB37512.1 hypothetical protein M948_02905 [Virgibacillus sp. CM-4]GGJ60413.1 UPF0271 protein [Virgibacillus kapii]CDQ38971.1 LamB/YcsF family protein [Virgibacillus massiliensis]
MTTIDINCDMGESYGAFMVGEDETIMNYISSANIACGMHAGDPHVMERTVRLAKKNRVGIGAHPGFPDIAGFGRRMMEFTEEEIYQLIIYQIGGLQAFCSVHDVTLKHVKPHGALYNLAARDEKVADAIARAVYDLDSNLILIGLANSALLSAGIAAGINVASEVFADRTFTAEGFLTPRNVKGAFIYDVKDAAEQMKRIVVDQKVKAIDGTIIDLKADTICIHGDGKHAVAFAEALQTTLSNNGITIKRLGEK